MMTQVTIRHRLHLRLPCSANQSRAWRLIKLSVFTPTTRTPSLRLLGACVALGSMHLCRSLEGSLLHRSLVLKNTESSCKGVIATQCLLEAFRLAGTPLMGLPAFLSSFDAMAAGAPAHGGQALPVALLLTAHGAHHVPLWRGC